MFKYSDIDRLIQGVYDGTITEYDLPEDLYQAIAKYLKSGVYKGFGSTLATVAEGDLELLKELRENVYMFSAAKTYQQVKEMGAAVMDGDQTRPFNEFKKLASEIFNTYNKDYLKTEYDTAIGQAQMAVKWNTIQEQKDILPYLVYSTIGDACDICAPLDEFTAPVDDPVWDVIMPLNHFNCHCLVEQSDDADSVTPKDERDSTFEAVSDRMDDVFKMNPGKDGYVFSPDHPYFTVPKDDKGFAQENFGLEIPDGD